MKEKVIKAVRDNSDEFPTHLISFVSTALRISPDHLENLPWEYVVDAFYKIVAKVPIVKLPLTAGYIDTVSNSPWDYEGRTWHLYSHLLAKAYGWKLDYISQLQVEEALAKIQEILTDEQLGREFIYSLSEIAYPYDQSTKKSTFQPLPRPAWMRTPIKPTQKLIMPLSSIPVGNVNNDAVPEEDKPKAYLN